VNYFINVSLKDISEEQIKHYLYNKIEKDKISYSTQNQIVNAIKFYYEAVLGNIRKVYRIERPRKKFNLPKVISEENIIKLLKVTTNLKHKCIIAMLYSKGVKRSELINLRLQDIDFEKNFVYISKGKGKKDRITILGEKIQILLKRYIEEYKRKYWLFEGAGRKRYSTESIRNIIKKSQKMAGIQTEITFHVLRYSFATHLLDKGVDIRYIKKLLGHHRLETTSISTHVSSRSLANIKSPLDEILSDSKLKHNNLKK